MLQSKLKFPIESIQSICRRYRVRELSVFGSALREDFKTDSDVDLLVEFEPAYFAVQWSIVWVAATQDALGLRDKVTDILTREYPEASLSE